MMMLAMFFFAAQDAIAKKLAQSFALPLVVWARYSVNFLLLMLFLAPSMRLKLVRTQRPLLQLTRSLLLVFGSMIGLAAFRLMPLAEATAIIMLAPLLVALLAGRFLGEALGRGHWLAICIGFTGILFIARPGGALSLAGTLLALVSALSYANYQLMTRRLAATENSYTTLFYAAAVGTVVMSLALPWYWPEQMPDAGQSLLFAATGGCSAIGHFLLTRAFHHAPASTLTPLTYAQLLWATLIGWPLFGQFPDPWAILGMLIIAGSGIVVTVTGHASRRAEARD